MRPLRPHRALAVLAAVALLGACGEGTGSSTGAGTGAGGSGSSGSSSSTSAGPSPSTTGTTGTTQDPDQPTLPSSGRGKLVTVTGTVSDGVESGCLMLTPEPASPDGPWQLIGNTAGIRAGQKVTVRGARIDMVSTTCQQGMPFDVQTVLTS